MTPYMQSAAAKGSSSRKTYGRKYGLGGHEQGNFSMELWKKAFKDACERLCPARAGGHECGCLPLLARLVCLCITIPSSMCTLSFSLHLETPKG